MVYMYAHKKTKGLLPDLEMLLGVESRDLSGMFFSTAFL